MFKIVAYSNHGKIEIRNLSDKDAKLNYNRLKGLGYSPRIYREE